MLRPGSAGSDTAADHLRLPGEAIAALPPALRRRLMITCDGAGASHALVKELDRLASRQGYQVTYSVGWEFAAREKAAIGKVPEAAWEIAVDGRGQVRERRSGDACASPRCAHPKCWTGEAHVAELTGLLREGPDGDQLTAWPKTMRVFARRERPHPGAQLSLLEAADGWRYSLWATSLPAPAKGWRGRCACTGAAHRVHARAGDVIRTGKDTGLGHFPSHDYQISQARLDASMIACTLLSWLKLLALDGGLAKAEPKTCATASCTPPPALSAAAAAEPWKSPPPGPGQKGSPPPGNASRPSRTQPDQHEPVPASKEGSPRGTVEPRPPGPTTGPPSYPGPKIHVRKPRGPPASGSHQPP